MRVVGDLPRMAVGVDEDAGVAAPERLGAVAWDRGARRLGLGDDRIDLGGRADVVRQRDAAPAARVLDAAVLRQLIAAPERDDHPLPPGRRSDVVGRPSTVSRAHQRRERSRRRAPERDREDATTLTSTSRDSSSSGLIGPVERLQDEVAGPPGGSMAPAEQRRLAHRCEAGQHVRRRLHLGRARGQAGDDLGEHARVGRDGRQPLVRARRRFVGEPPRHRLGTVQRPRSRRRRAGRRSPGRAGRAPSPNARHGGWSPSGTSATQSATPTEAEKSAPVFSRCRRGEVVRLARDVAVLPADHPERRTGRARVRPSASDRTARAGMPP